MPRQRTSLRPLREEYALSGSDVMAGEKPSKLKFGAKSEFVRSLDPSIPAAEVVAMAEKKGMKLTTALVYNIRSAAKARNSHARSAIKRKVGGKAGKLPAKLRRETPESLLRAAIAQIGLSRAREILEEVEATFAGE